MKEYLVNTAVIAKREFLAYFTSPVAYVFLVIFLLLSGFFTFMVGQEFFSRNEASLASFFLWHPWLYLFFVPAVAMRLWSEEKRTGTLELLLTLPITPGQTVIAKFIASWAFLILALALTFPIWITANYLGSPDNGAIFAAYVGSALMAGAYLAIGCMTSALTRNQVVSFILSVVICLFTLLAGFPPVTDFIQSQFPGNEAIVTVVANLSVMTHFEALQRGVVHLRDLLFFASVIALTLFATAAIIRSGLESKQAQGFAMSSVQVGMLAIILLLFNAILFPVRAKADFTEENIHTLSQGTKNILARLANERKDEDDSFKVEARLYFTQGEDRVSVAVRQYAARVHELLREFRDESQGGLVYNRINPQPDTDEEELAQHDNVTRMQVSLEEYAYLGLTLSYADKTEQINLLERGQGGGIRGLRSEGLLEYDIASAIARMLPRETKRPTIGIMSSLQVMGGFPPGLPPQMMQRQRPAPPWAMMQILWKEYGREKVRTVDMSVDVIPSEIDLLLVVHPKEITERAEFAIDQFILRGGKVAAFLDPHHALDRGAMGGFGPPPGDSRSNLPNLLKAWGLTFNDREVVADVTYALRPPRSGVHFPTALDIQRDDHSEDDPLVQNLGPLSGLHFGAFTGDATKAGLKPSMLFQSSTNSMVVSSSNVKPLLPFRAFQEAQAKVADDFNGTSTARMLALTLTGNFKTAFADGDPEAVPPDANATAPRPPDTALKTVAPDVNPMVVLVGDVDFLHEGIHQLTQLRVFNISNFDFLLNLIDYMTGDQDLLLIRGRGNRSRPLKKLNEMEEKATASIQSQIKELEKKQEDANKELADVEKRINEQLNNAIRSGQTGMIQIQISEEDKRKLTNARAEADQQVKDAAKSIRRIKKKRTGAVNDLRNRIKWMNIAGMPLIITAFGIGVAIRRKQKTQAR